MKIYGQKVSNLKLFKYAATAVTSLGVSVIVNGAIDTVTPKDLGIVRKVAVVVGGFMLSNMVCHVVCDHTDKKIDSTIKQAISILQAFGEMNDAINSMVV